MDEHQMHDEARAANYADPEVYTERDLEVLGAAKRARAEALAADADAMAAELAVRRSSTPGPRPGAGSVGGGPNIVEVDKDNTFVLADGSRGNPGCDECGTYDATVKVDGVYLCESAALERGIRSHLPKGECCVGVVAGPGQRLIEFTSVYDDGEKFVILHVLDVDPGLDAEAVEELLEPHTGVGHPGDAGYFARSVDGMVPEINLEWYG